MLSNIPRKDFDDNMDVDFNVPIEKDRIDAVDFTEKQKEYINELLESKLAAQRDRLMNYFSVSGQTGFINHVYRTCSSK